ncbi:hypothetical protein UPYG_G00230000 [Umbra pygmaea]|uniref:SANTA domain-containing protein n=1 Tax=Umbra pygmaea TaxID=75934 RepID=A0ABD0WE49_UMBPY
MNYLLRHNLDGVFYEEDSPGRVPSQNLECKQVTESPANVFARMKARVRMERLPVESKGSNAEKPISEERDRQFNLIRKINQPWVNCKQKENNFKEFTHKSEALSLSLGKSPNKGFPYSHFLQNTPTKGLPSDTISVSLSPLKVVSHLKERNSITLSEQSEPMTLSLRKPLRKALAHPHNIIHKQDFQGLPTKVMGSGASIPTNRNTPIIGPAPLAFSTQSAQRAFSYPHAPFKANHIQQQAFPKDVQCGLEATIMPVSRSESADGGKMEPNDIVHEEFVVKSPILDQRPSHDFTASDIFVLKENRRKEQYHHRRPDSISGGSGQYQSTPACVTGGKTENAIEKDTFVYQAVPSDLSDPSCDPPSPRHLPGLVHDPLLQLSPKIYLPRKREAVFHAKPTVVSTGSNAKSIKLRHWTLKSRSNSLYVEGIRVDDKMPWHSNIITERISQNVLMTISGSTYVLEGQMDADFSKTELPANLLKKFIFGFPKNWKELLEGFLSMPKGESKATSRDQKLKATKRSSSTSQKTKRSVSCRNTSSATFSRSGRLLKPPLEYWKGARVILDCDMNVTIHDGYNDFSIHNSEQSTPVARVMSHAPKKSAKIRLPPAEENRQVDSSEEEAVPVRKVKAYHRPPKPGEIPSHTAPKSLRCRAEDNDPCNGAESLPPQMCISGDVPERMGPTRVTILRSRGKAEPDVHSDPGSQSLNTLRFSRRRPIKLSSGEESPELLLGKQITKFQNSEHPRVLVMKMPAKQLDNFKLKPSVTERRVLRHNGSATGVRWNRIQDSEGDSSSESRSDEEAAQKRPKAKASYLQRDLRKIDSESDEDSPKKGPKANAVKSGPLSPRVTRTRGRLLGDSGMALGRLLTSPDDLERDYRKTDSKSTSDDYVQKKRSKAKAVTSGALNPQVTRTSGRLLGDSVMTLSGLSTSPDDLQRELTKMSQSDNDFDDDAQKQRSKAKVVKLQHVNPRGKRTPGRVLEDDTQSTKRAGPQNSSGKSSRCAVQWEESKEHPEQWTEAELLRLNEAVTSIPKHVNDFWTKVAWLVSTRSAGDCQEQYNAQALTCQNTVRAKKEKKVPQKEEACVKPSWITAKKGTLKRKQQVRNLLDHMPKDEHDDIFNSSPMQNKRIKLPTVSPNGAEDVLMRSVYDPQTPGSSGFPSVKTPQCLHITPGMMALGNRNDDDKYIYQLQKRMKKCQVKPNLVGATSKYSPTPATKRVIKRCNTENDSSFVVWEMFPDKDVSVESGEEEDFYFVDED